MTEVEQKEILEFYQRLKAMFGTVDFVETLKAHKHNKNDFPGVNFQDLDGLIPVSSLSPSIIPTNVGQQFRLTTNGDNVFLYIYDDINSRWVRFNADSTVLTEIGSTNNKDTNLIEGSPTTNDGSGAVLSTRKDGSNNRTRTIMHWTLPSNSGTITKISLFLKQESALANPGTIEVHELTEEDWTEAGATWNKYDGITDWAAAGGDFDATIVDSVVAPGDETWAEFILQGSGATNPITTLTWGSELHLLLRDTEAGMGADTGALWYSGEATNSGDRPYIEITFTI
jgi:hypothetical protein